MNLLKNVLVYKYEILKYSILLIVFLLIGYFGDFSDKEITKLRGIHMNSFSKQEQKQDEQKQGDDTDLMYTLFFTNK